LFSALTRRLVSAEDKGVVGEIGERQVLWNALIGKGNGSADYKGVAGTVYGSADYERVAGDRVTGSSTGVLRT
jgi:hypothetical protein